MALKASTKFWGLDATLIYLLYYPVLCVCVCVVSFDAAMTSVLVKEMSD